MLPQNMEHKFVELLAADFTVASQEVMQQMIGWRYKMQQSKLALMQASLADVYALVSCTRIFHARSGWDALMSMHLGHSLLCLQHKGGIQCDVPATR